MFLEPRCKIKQEFDWGIRVTHEGPASRRRTEMLGSSVSRFAITLPAAPAAKKIEMSTSFLTKEKESHTADYDEIEGRGR
jgi:hypothetical protein